MWQINNSRRKFLIKSAIGGAVLASLGGLGVILHKDQTWVESAPYERGGSGPANTVVIAVAFDAVARLDDAGG